MIALLALLDERKQPAGSIYDSISLERAITRQAFAVLRCGSRAAVDTIRRLSAAGAGAQGTS